MIPNETNQDRKQRLEILGAHAAGIAHDMNNILTTITLTLGMVSAEAGNEEAVRGWTEDLGKACGQATEMIRQILAFSRQNKPEQTPMRLQPVVAETIRMVGSGLPENIHLDAKIDPLAPVVVANACQVQQVVLNLSVNAIHAMRKRGGRLTIQLDTAEPEAETFEKFPDLRPGRHVRLTVKDTGCGMDEDTAKRVFEPFFTTKPPSEGNGLGLAIVQNIVRDHEGAVMLQSLNGLGTVLTVYFPIRDKGIKSEVALSNCFPEVGRPCGSLL